MTIKLEVNGRQYSQFNNASINSRLDALSSAFGIEVTSNSEMSLPFTGGEPCRIFVDGELVLTGSIEVVSIDFSARRHTIKIEGRDKTGDLLDSTLGPISSLSGNGLTLKKLIETIVSELGVDVEVIDNVNPEPFNAAEDIGSPQPGDNAFEFIEKFTRKRQVLISNNSEGNIVISKSEGTNTNSVLRNVRGSNENNIMSASVSYDTTGRFNVYKFTSSLNLISLNFAGLVSAKDTVDQTSEPVTDRAVRKGRQMVLISELSASKEQNNDRAEWEKKIRQARGRVYSVVVDGFRNQDGNLWANNTLVTVNDDFADINSQMLINSVGFSFDLAGGSQTTLTLVEPDAYTIELEEPQKGNIGNEVFNFPS